MTPATLAGLVALWPGRFHPQTWYHGEAFMSRCGVPVARVPSRVDATGDPLAVTVPAVDLVIAYLQTPEALLWHRYIWTADVDAKGQRVYVGGCGPANGYRLEIHRHLAITDQWGTPTWE